MMPISRRFLLGLAGMLAAMPTEAAPTDPLFAPRTLGKPSAKVTVIEYFSLTCPHCADFAAHTFPEVRREMIDTGKVFYVFRDFPLDRVALMAAMVARALPLERYVPFIDTLFATQDRWAFRPGINYANELWKYAALAGMPHTNFEATLQSNNLSDFIIAEEKEAESRYRVNATPSFIINGKLFAGMMSYAAFAQLVSEAAA